MRLILLSALTMLAFAANSLLTRAALAEEAIGPAAFATIRTASGAIVLLALIALQSKGRLNPATPNAMGIVGLALYMLTFSYAYTQMDAGPGALILFGGTQITMFAGALTLGERPPLRRWAGMAVALGGLALLTLPGAQSAPAVAMSLMALAALGWGVYNLAGRHSQTPLLDTAWNFVYALPAIALGLVLWPGTASATPPGVILAVISGGLTSALGYALWYSLLPHLGATRAALAQLSVPVITLGLGAWLLSENVTQTALAATLLILGGIALGLSPAKGAARRRP